MNRDLARQVADAVLYEGYMLYPYRRSALKNRQRWSFGILYPPAYGEVRGGTERGEMHSECLLQADGVATVDIELRFLHLLTRRAEQVIEASLMPITSPEVNAQGVESWDEGVERSVKLVVDSLGGSMQGIAFSFPATHGTEVLQDKGGAALQSVSRIQHEVAGRISVSSERLDDCVWKLVINVANESSLPADASDREGALLQSLVSAHTVLTVTHGEFVSLLDPPATLRDMAGSCKNTGNFPVLIGASQERDMMLCSPIVLYDYPQIAPESAGDFYDSTEMDEMLTLRIMTLTEEEKSEMRSASHHARALLERTEQGAREQLMRTHGTIRNLRAVSERT